MAFLTAASIVIFADSNLDKALQQKLYAMIPGYWRLEGSQRFLTDFVVGLLVAGHFLAVRVATPMLAPALSYLQPLAVRLAGMSFSLYLFHRPLTKLSSHFFPNTAHSQSYGLGVALAIMAIIAILAQITEQHKEPYKRLVAWVLSRGNRELSPAV